MPAKDPKIDKVEGHFLDLAAISETLNEASDQLSKSVSSLDEALKRLNLGIEEWINYDSGADPEELGQYDNYDLGYAKVSGKWGIALRRLYGHESYDDHHSQGPWAFAEAPREMRIASSDKIPDLIEALTRSAFKTAQAVSQKSESVRAIANVIEGIAKAQSAVAGKRAGQ